MLNKIFVKSKLSLTMKICLAGLFIALVTILQKVVAINYISLIPFVRISFGGCALLMFASILLGPWFGLLIGAASDILGYFIFDPKNMGFFPQITAIYAVLGFVSYFIFMFVRMVKNKKIMFLVEIISFVLLLGGITVYTSLNDDLTLYGSTYHLELWQKITIPCVLFGLLLLLIICIILTDRYFKKRFSSSLPFNVYQVSFSAFILEVFVMILFGTLMKGFAFGFQTYAVILISQIIVGLINIPLNTFIISYIMLPAKRFFNVQNETK